MKFVIIGGGPAGNSCATSAARLGAEVTLVENTLFGGSAHLRDCIPSKTMIGLQQGSAAGDFRNELDSAPNLEGLKTQVNFVTERLGNNLDQLLKRQGIETIHGSGQLKDKNEIIIETQTGMISKRADVIVLASGSRARIPDWCEPDGKRIFQTCDVYPPPEIPDHIVIVGSGISGVEMTHLFSKLGSQVTLLVSRQHVLPDRDPEVAAVLEEDFQSRGIKLLKGARANGVQMDSGSDKSGSDNSSNNNAGLTVLCEDGRQVHASHMLLAIGALPNFENLGLDAAGVETDNGYVSVDHHLRTNVPHIYAAGDLAGKTHLSSVASTQGKKIAEHAMGLVADRPHRHIDYDKAPTAIFTEPEIADVGLGEVDAFSEGRKVRVTKVPFSVSARALIQGDIRGFVKIVSDPATGVVLGGSIVGRHASELIAVLSLAVTAGLTVTDLVDSMSVHPSLVEVLFEAAE